MVKISAHRGLSHQFPENTRIAFKKAAELGVDMVELDVRLSEDQKVVVSHDDDLYRCSGTRALISKLSYEKIREVDVGKGQTVPLLSDVLNDLSAYDLQVNIEIKQFEMEKQVLQVVSSTNSRNMVMYSSFLFPVLMELRDLDESAILCPLIGDIGTMTLDALVKQVHIVHGQYLNVEYKSLSENIVTHLHDNNIKVQAWTPDTTGDFRRLSEMGVDVIITNEPRILLDFLKNH